MEETVVRHSHCGTHVYSFSGCPRAQCPVCHQTRTSGLSDAPVALPCPFTDGHRVPCAFLVASVHGPAHLGEWTDTEIHVGLSNSEAVTLLWQVWCLTTACQVCGDAHGWERCVCIRLIPPERRDLLDSWDRELERFSVLPEWDSERFTEERPFGSCCYGFALSFINHMRRLDGAASLSRDEFTGRYVLPRMKTVSRYINIYHAISQHGFYIVNDE